MDNLVAVNQPQIKEINVDEVLKEYGLEDLEETVTVVQNGSMAITIPTTSVTYTTTVDTVDTLDTFPNDITEDSILEPPPVVSPPDELLNIPENWESDITSGSPNIDTADATGESSAVETDAVAFTQENTETQNQMLTAEEVIKYLIPANSRALEVDETTSRFSGAAWFEAIQKSTVVLAGLGGIGSWVSMILSRMKPAQLFMYDDDVVERGNLSGQLYSTSMVNKKKVTAMALLVKEFSEYNSVFAIPSKFKIDTTPGDIMICGFDNMTARKLFFTAWLNHVLHHPHPENCLFIDGRLDMEEFQVFCFTGDNRYSINRYNEEYLFDDWKAESTMCSMKQTTYCANMIGSVIVNLFTNFISNTLKPIVERALPFKTYYNASMMYLKTEN